MQARTSVVLMVLAALLGVLVAVQASLPLFEPEPIEPIDSSLGELSDSSSSTSLDQFAPPPLASLTETVDRPLFNNTRRVPESPVVVTSEPDAPEPVSATPPNLKLTAVVINGEDRVAVVRLPEGNLFERLREGDQVEGWLVDQVGPQSLRLLRGKTPHVVDLRSFEPAPARPAARRSAARAAANPSPARSATQSRPRRPTRGPRQRSRARSQTPQQ